jgi:hypothetical protein
MKFRGSRARCSLFDRRVDEDVLQELNVHLVQKKLAECKRKLLNHVSWLEGIIHPKHKTIDQSEDEDLDGCSCETGCLLA